MTATINPIAKPNVLVTIGSAILGGILNDLRPQAGSTAPAPIVSALDNMATHLAAIVPADEKTIGQIFVAVGGIVEAFFPQYDQEGAFLVAVGNALIAGKGTIGPLRLGDLAITLSVEPWKQ